MIRARRPSAAPCCNRIDLVASPRFALVCLAWLTLACLLVCAAEQLHWASRFGCAFTICAAGARTLRRVVWLRGSRAVCSLEWVDQGGFIVGIGHSGRRLAAVPAGRCLRYGQLLWILRFQSSEGVFQVLLDPSVHDPKAIRRLSRRLGWGRARGS